MKNKSLTRFQMNKILSDIEEAEEIDETFRMSNRPENMSEMKEASRQAKIFYKFADKYGKASNIKNIPEVMKNKIKELLNNNSVYDPEEDI